MPILLWGLDSAGSSSATQQQQIPDHEAVRVLAELRPVIGKWWAVLPRVGCIVHSATAFPSHVPWQLLLCHHICQCAVLCQWPLTPSATPAALAAPAACRYLMGQFFRDPVSCLTLASYLITNTGTV
jgi:hypothetical protein